MPSAPAKTIPTSGYGPLKRALPWKAGRFSGQDFTPQPDGTLRCPAGASLSPQERRPERDGSLRVVYAASIRSCRPRPLREQCQWQGCATKKPRQVSMLLHPLTVGPAPLLWRDWSRRQPRRACLQLHSQRLEAQMEPALPANSAVTPLPLSRAQRAHYRLSFQERLARNARAPGTGQVTIKLFGLPEAFAAFLGLPTASWVVIRPRLSVSTAGGKAHFSSPQGALWLLVSPFASVFALVCPFSFPHPSLFRRLQADQPRPVSFFYTMALLSGSQPRCASLLKKSLHQATQQEITLPERSAAVPRDTLNGPAGELIVSQPLDAPALQRRFPLSPDRWSGSLRGDRS